MEEKGKRLKTDDGDGDGDGEITLLPEALIQHIQSFLTEKEAVRSTLLSKSWHEAWLTRSTLDFDQSRRCRLKFAELATGKMRRYENLNLTIDRFRLRTTINTKKSGTDLLAYELIVKALKMGATDLNLEFRPSNLILPREVLDSETLVRLSVSGRKIEIYDGKVKYWKLKSLTLDRVIMRSDDVFRDIVSCCVLIEELSLSNCRSLGSNGRGYKMLSLGSAMNSMYKLKCLFLEFVNVGSLFLNGFGSRFPWLKELSVDRCSGFKTVEIASSSLERIAFLKVKGALKAEIDAPNLVKFSYSGQSIPSSLCIKSSREWKCFISTTKNIIRLNPNLQGLKKLLTQLSLSSNAKISLSIDAKHYSRNIVPKAAVCEAPLAILEKLTISVPIYDSGMTLVLDLFRICRPKLIFTDSWWTNKEFRAFVSTKLMKDMIATDCGIPDQDMFGEFGLNLVKVQLYEETFKEWQTLVMTQPLHAYKPGITPAPKIRLQLGWLGMN